MYVTGFVIPVPTDRFDAYLEHERIATQVLRDLGATRVLVCWGDDTPHGERTSFPRAVELQPGETVAFGMVDWPSREACEAAMGRIQDDPRLADSPMPFDGMRMIFGGFRVVLDG